MRGATFLCAAVAVASRSSSAVTPVQKVIQLLEDMVAKGEKDKHEETKQFAVFKTFCEGTTDDKKQAVKDANRQITDLNASIAKNDADQKQLAREVEGHEHDIAVWQGDQNASQKVRDIEEADFSNLDRDYSESLDALDRAIATLQKQNYDRPQAQEETAAALAQIATLVPAKDRATIDAFLAQKDDGDNEDQEHLKVEAPAAHGYRFQSQSVIDLLVDLKNKFDAQRQALRKKEDTDIHQFNMLQQELRNQIAEANRQRDKKQEERARKLQAKGNDEAELADTTETRDDDAKYLSDLTATCEKKATDFESRQQLRADEIAAIHKAIEILAANSVSGASEKHLPQLVQAPTFLQLRSDHNQLKVATFLKDRAERLKSPVLSALAIRVADDPFHKVKKMIKDLIFELMQQATAEAEKKGWCDTELTSNKQIRKEKTRKVQELHAFKDELEASTAKLQAAIEDLTKQIADSDKAVAEAVAQRADEKAQNTQTIKDSLEAQTAVAQALEVLQQFYAQAGEATAFVQAPNPESPEIFDSPYKGMQSEGGGVVSMLEVIQSDFARVQSTTQAAEDAAQKEHQEFLNDSEVDTAAKAKDVEHKTASRQAQLQALSETKEDLIATQKELDAANAYFDSLKPQCIDDGSSFEDRAARREEEVESLQEALRILSGEDFS